MTSQITAELSPIRAPKMLNRARATNGSKPKKQPEMGFLWASRLAHSKPMRFQQTVMCDVMLSSAHEEDHKF